MNDLIFSFFYELPVWLWSAIFVLFTLVFATLFNFLTDKFSTTKMLKQEVQLSTSVMQVSGTIFAVLLALIVVSVFEQYSRVETVMFEEATYAGNIFRDTFLLDKKNANILRKKIYSYLNHVYNVELPAQKSGGEEIKIVKVTGNQQIEDIINVIAELHSSPILQGELINQINQLLKFRRIRIGFTTQSHLPNTIWFTLIFGSILLILNISLMQSEKRLNLNAFCYIYILSIDLMLVLIIGYDRPFCGELSVSGAPYEQVMMTMKKRLNYNGQEEKIN